MTKTITELGITVMPEYFQSDGVDSVLEKVVNVARATSVTTSPYVVTRAPKGVGHREPPLDGGAGKHRLLDRPLWGKHEVWMEAACSFTPQANLYSELAYQPPQTDTVTRERGAVVGEFLDAAKVRGLETWMQIQAAIPPCHRVQFGGPTDGDRPLLPNGTAVPNRVDNNASLASPALRSYMQAFVTDLCRAYPQVDGFKFDWPEYPAYHFDSLFFDFNPAASRFAAPLGLDFEVLRRGCASFLKDLTTGAVRHKSIALDDFAIFRESLFAAYPVLADLVAFRTAIVTDYARFLRDLLNEASAGRCSMFLQTFPPPLNILTGFDLSAAGKHCDMVGVKLYTMHWPLIERNYLDSLITRASFTPESVARSLSVLLALSPRNERDPISIRYPEPDEPHPCATADLIEKTRTAKASIPQGTRFCSITHAYGPIADFVRRFEAAALGAGGAVHINRFGYLSDAKLQAIGARMDGSVAASGEARAAE
ncbi:MAG: hypothetical protein WD005_05780 [Haliea sp.]